MEFPEVNQQVKLSTEYWESLKIIAKKKKYSSRQHLVAELLRSFVHSEPGAYEAGVSMSRLINVGDSQEPEMLVIPHLQEREEKKYVFVAEDGWRSPKYPGRGALDAFRRMKGNMNLSVYDMRNEYKKVEEYEAEGNQD